MVSAPLLTLQGNVNSGISSPVGFLWQERKQDVLPSHAPQPREETAALCAPAWLPVRAAVMPLQWLHQKCIGQSKLDIKQVPQVVTAVGAPCQDPVQVWGWQAMRPGAPRRVCGVGLGLILLWLQSGSTGMLQGCHHPDKALSCHRSESVPPGQLLPSVGSSGRRPLPPCGADTFLSETKYT